MDKDLEFITAVEVTSANLYDGQVAKDLVDQEPEGLRPQRLIGDHSYGTGETRKEMAERHIEVVAPVAEARNPKGIIKKTDFRWTWRRKPAVVLPDTRP